MINIYIIVIKVDLYTFKRCCTYMVAPPLEQKFAQPHCIRSYAYIIQAGMPCRRLLLLHSGWHCAVCANLSATCHPLPHPQAAWTPRYYLRQGGCNVVWGWGDYLECPLEICPLMTVVKNNVVVSSSLRSNPCRKGLAKDFHY